MVPSRLFCHIKKEEGNYETFIINTIQTHVGRIIFLIVHLTWNMEVEVLKHPFFIFYFFIFYLLVYESMMSLIIFNDILHLYANKSQTFISFLCTQFFIFFNIINQINLLTIYSKIITRTCWDKTLKSKTLYNKVKLEFPLLYTLFAIIFIWAFRPTSLALYMT